MGLAGLCSIFSALHPSKSGPVRTKIPVRKHTVHPLQSLQYFPSIHLSPVPVRYRETYCIVAVVLLAIFETRLSTFDGNGGTVAGKYWSPKQCQWHCFRNHIENSHLVSLLPVPAIRLRGSQYWHTHFCSRPLKHAPVHCAPTARLLTIRKKDPSPWTCPRAPRSQTLGPWQSTFCPRLGNSWIHLQT